MIDTKKVAVGILLLIIFVILVFTIVGNTADDLKEAADSVSDANNCTDGDETDETGVAHYYNFTDKYCHNTTAQLYVAGQIDLPLNTLFGRSSILILIFMAAILILAIVTVLKGLKGKE